MSEQFNNPNPTPSFWSNLFNSATFRMFIVGFLVLILLIPLFFVQDLIRERERTSKETINNMNNKWGNSILLYGPMLRIPYTLKKETHYVYLFPEELKIDGKIDAELRYRGIYQSTVYNINSDIKGNFSSIKPNQFDGVSDDILQWNRAQIVIQTTNIKGIGSKLEMNLGQQKLSLKVENFSTNTAMQSNYDIPSDANYMLTSNYFNPKVMLSNELNSFHLPFISKGSQKFEIIPIGKETVLSLNSNWVDPDFSGDFLPSHREINQKGFKADWRILEMNRPFAQQFTELPTLNSFALGVNLMIPVDNYLQNERSAKYGFLVIGLTFLLFFLFQTLSKINIHPFQYLLIGLALIIFYTLLLSISEHSNFTTAYIVSAIATIVLITLFSKSIMKTWKFPLFVFIALTALYSFIYVIIQLESYALLVGSIGLFAILAGVMYASRKIEWS